MAKFRYAILENDKAITAANTSGTETIDLPEDGILSDIDFMCRKALNYTDDTPLPLWAAIQKLEVLVDGSTVVKSIDGRQAKALCWYNKGPFDKLGWYQPSGSHNVYYHHFPLYFGRFAGDTKYGLDLGAYANPQLKVTWNMTTTTDHGVTYDAVTTPAFTYNVQAKVIDGQPAGFTNKYIQSRQIDDWATANSTEHNAEIPRGYDLRGVMIEGAYLNINWFDIINHVKLDFDNGKWVPIDMDYENVKACHISWWPEECAINQAYYGATGDGIDVQLMEVNGHSSGATDLDNATIAYGFTTYGASTLLKYTEAGVAQATASYIWLRDAGWGPMGTTYIPMAQLLDGGVEEVRTTDYGRIDLKIQTGSAAGTSAHTKVVAEYAKPNGQ